MATPGYKIVGPDGRETAPFDSDALISYARRGYIQPTSSVFDPTVGQWIPASQVNALASLNGGMPPPPPPPSSPPPPGQPYQSYQPHPSPGYAPYSPAPSKPFPRGAAIAIGIGVGLLVAFGAFGIGKLATSKQTIPSYDRLYAVSVPVLWHKFDNKDPKIISYISTDQGVMVLRLTKQPILNSEELDLAAGRVAQVSEKNFNVDTLVSQVSTLKVGGYDARQFVIDDDGHVGFHRFQKTLIATPDGIYDVTTFADRDEYDSEETGLGSVLNSFHRTSTPAPRNAVGVGGVDVDNE